jgi:hypothetical protein
MIPQITKWMGENSYSKDDIKAFKAAPDHRCSVTMGSTASMLLRGMPAAHPEDPENDTATWLRGKIDPVIVEGKEILKNQKVEDKVGGPVLSIQDRIREASYTHMEGIVDWIENWLANPAKFDPKALNPINFFKSREINQAHARIIRDFYARDLAELEELASGKADEQLKEGYSHRSKKQIRTFIDFLKEVNEACTMLMQEAKVTRKPRAKKAVPADKVVAKMKYMKTFEPLKLVSINPTDILGAKELWVYNTKTRKLGKYVANEYMELGVKGTSLTGFSEAQSICKTVRKPEEKLKEFKAAGKVQLRKFLEEINATDTRMNGRINEETILLKVA